MVRVTEVRVHDKGSQPQSVRVNIAGVSIDGVLDAAAELTIVGAETFKHLAAVKKLRKRDLKPADKTPLTYGQRTIRLDGRLDLDITFEGCTMNTPIYVKMDAKEELLLSEGVCRQLGIVKYHEKVVPGYSKTEGMTSNTRKEGMYVPAVRVQLVETVKLKPVESIRVLVKLVENEFPRQPPTDACHKPGSTRTMLLESTEQVSEELGVELSSTLVESAADGLTHALINNCHSSQVRFPQEHTLVMQNLQISSSQGSWIT